jgi:hypothetical protein
MNAFKGPPSPVLPPSGREAPAREPSAETWRSPAGTPAPPWGAEAGARLARILLLAAGGGLVALGLLVDGPALARWVAGHLTPDGALSPESLAQVAAFRPVILAAGAILVLAAILVRPATALYLGLESLAIGIVGFGHRFLVRPLAWMIARLPSAAARLVPRSARAPLGFLLLLAFVAWMAMFAHSSQPLFHSDGIDLQPPRNLAQHGRYATHTREGWDLLTYRISTGPSMLLPTALGFAIFGPSREVADLVALGFFLGFLILAYWGFRRSLGAGAVVLGLTLFCLNPSNIFFGPSNGYVSGAKGESPALLFLVTGVLLWCSALERKSHARLLLAGIAFGLAFQAKWLFLFSLPALLATWGVMAIAGRREPARAYLLPALGLLIPPAAFYLMRLSQVGFQGEAAHLARLWDNHGVRAMGFTTDQGQVQSIFAVARPLITLAQIDFWRGLAAFLTLPAAIYVGTLLRRRLEPFPLYFLVFTSIWFTWWVLFSYDLPLQHLLYIMPFAYIFAGKLIADGLSATAEPVGGVGNVALSRALRVAIGIAILGYTAIPLARQIDQIVQARTVLQKPYAEMVAYVNQHTEPDAVFSGWAWSLPWWLAVDRDRAIKDRFRYPFSQREAGGQVEYFVVAPEWPFSRYGTGWPNVSYPNRWTLREDARRQEFVARHCTLLLTTGDQHQWLLYRVKPLSDTVAVAPPADPTPIAAGGP